MAGLLTQAGGKTYKDYTILGVIYGIYAGIFGTFLTGIGLKFLVTQPLQFIVNVLPQQFPLQLIAFAIIGAVTFYIGALIKIGLKIKHNNPTVRVWETALIGLIVFYALSVLFVAVPFNLIDIAVLAVSSFIVAWISVMSVKYLKLGMPTQ